ncbi:MAG: ATP-binding protein [Bacteroidales bacterium]
MNKDEIKKTIVSQQEFLMIKSPVLRSKMAIIQDYTETPFVIILSGIRRCGKSTVLQLIRKKSKNNFAINFDDNRLVNFKVEDFEKLYESFIELFGEENTFYFDEIQNIKGWEKFVRRLHNEGRKVYITGSNVHILSKETGTYLTGRNIQIELFPFSFTEYLDFKGYKFEKNDLFSTVKTSLLKKEFLNYLTIGGFPEYLQTQQTDFLKNLYDNILYKDILARYKIKNEAPLKELLYYLVSNISKEHSYNSLARTIGVANALTVKEYISYFENSYLLFTVNKFDYSLKKQLFNPKKIYVIDNGLANSVSFSFTDNRGQQLENLVYIQLRRTYKEIFYHKNKHECDFMVFEKGKALMAIQVSWSLNDKKTSNREIHGLIEAMETHSLNTGQIITYDEENEIILDSKTIQVIPVWKWLIL